MRIGSTVRPSFLKKPLSAATSKGNAAVGNSGIATRIVSCAGALRAARPTIKTIHPNTVAIFIYACSGTPSSIQTSNLLHSFLAETRDKAAVLQLLNETAVDQLFGIECRSLGIARSHFLQNCLISLQR